MLSHPASTPEQHNPSNDAFSHEAPGTTSELPTLAGMQDDLVSSPPISQPCSPLPCSPRLINSSIPSPRSDGAIVAKPKGVLGREKGGYRLSAALAWDPVQYSVVQVRLTS